MLSGFVRYPDKNKRDRDRNQTETDDEAQHHCCPNASPAIVYITAEQHPPGAAYVTLTIGNKNATKSELRTQFLSVRFVDDTEFASLFGSGLNFSSFVCAGIIILDECRNSQHMWILNLV